MPADTTTQDASAIAEEAFVLAYPLVVMHRTMVQATAVVAPEPETMRAPVNAIVHARDTPDTLRVSGWLDLRDEPIVLAVPATHGRYYALWLRDAWASVFASVGARTTGTASRAFAVLGPGRHRLRVPPDLTPIAAPTRTVHVAGCIEAVHDSADELQGCAHDVFGPMPLSRWHRDHAPTSRSTAGDLDPVAPVEQVERMDAGAFFSEVARLVADNPPDPVCRAALERLQAIGAWESLGSDLRERLERGLQAGRAVVRAQTPRPPGATGASWRVRSEFGPDGADPLHRARAARSGPHADPAIDVLHAHLDRDADGRPLNGGNRYLLRFAPDAPPPVHGFWSLEASPGTQGGAHSIGDLRGLTMDPDGSLPVYIQHRPPARKRKSNWLLAPPDEFSVALHLYWPRDEALQFRWSPPPVTRVD
jgi:hypothetical protein